MSISSIRHIIHTCTLVLLVLLTSCKREVVEVYEIDDINLYTSASEKKNLKTDEQFISILYTDLFAQSIDNTELNKLNTAYSSMGDKSLVIDIIIRGLLTNSNAIVSTNTEMRADPDLFIEETYKRFFVRKPNEQEKWFLRNKIQENPALKPVDVYYALLTSDEYRYY